MIRSSKLSLLLRPYFFMLVLITGFETRAALAIEVQVSNAPANNLALTVGSIAQARKSIFLNIYELSSAEIANALIERIQAGIEVVILEEGSPVGGMSTTAKGIEASLTAAMANQKKDHFFIMDKGTGNRRYHFDHAKYAVIDDEFLLIGSENYSPTGNPSPGSVGNRGWEVLIHDPAIAQNYKSVFMTDSSTQFGDVSDATNHLQLSSQLEECSLASLLPTARSGGLPASQVTRITSPDTSLSGLLSLIQNARITLDIEQMTFDSTWNKTAGASPLTAAVIAAAKRGVKVRVLLNDEHSFDHPGKPAAPHNTDTVAIFNQAGVAAKIANLKAMGVDYIHNKGMLVDGNLTLISSINWGQNAVESNREAAVAIASPQVNSYFRALFDHDWQVSQGSNSNLQSLKTPPSQTSIPQALETFSQQASTSGKFVCPSKINFTALIGELKIQDTEDEDFKSLSGKKIQGEYTIETKSRACILLQDSDDHNLANRQIIELKTRPDGKLVLSFEGYTAKTHKIYSIRETFSGVDPSGASVATLYAGSGSKETLGTAKVEVKLTP